MRQLLYITAIRKSDNKECKVIAIDMANNIIRIRENERESEWLTYSIFRSIHYEIKELQ